METEKFATSYASITESSTYYKAASLCVESRTQRLAVPYRDTAVSTQQEPLFVQSFH